MKKVKWGVLGAASIAVRKVIPGMQKGGYCEISAIASRDKRKAEDAAGKLGIAKAYGSYEELLRDGEIEAVYNPLPNHLHVPWSAKAAEAGSMCSARSYQLERGGGEGFCSPYATAPA